jgi:hypothetical protein
MSSVVESFGTEQPGAAMYFVAAAFLDSVHFCRISATVNLS